MFLYTRRICSHRPHYTAVEFVLSPVYPKLASKASAENTILNNISVNLKTNINGGDIKNKTILYDELFPYNLLEDYIAASKT
jgi:hypothetical protein